MKTKQKNKSALTLGQMFDDTLKSRWSGRARETVEWQQAKNIEKVLGRDRVVESITPRDVDHLIECWRERGNKPATLNSKLATLKTALNHTRRRGMHSLDIHIDKIRHPSNARIRFFSEDQLENISDYLQREHPGFDMFFWFLVETGIRPGEARSLRPCDFREDPELGWVVDIVKTKNGDPRTVPLTKRAELAYSVAGPSVFSGYTPNIIARVWKEVRKHCDLGEDYVLYTARHTCATRLLSKGVSIRVAQSWLGHRDINQTLRYAKLVPSDLAAARDLLDQ